MVVRASATLGELTLSTESEYPARSEDVGTDER